MPVDERIKKCHQVQNIDLNSCHTLVYAIDELNEQNTKIWRRADNIKKISEPFWNKLDKAYTTIQDATGWLRDIVGDVD